jgi:hypothetical protein
MEISFVEKWSFRFCFFLFHLFFPLFHVPTGQALPMHCVHPLPTMLLPARLLCY